MADDLTALREQLSRVPESGLYVRVDKRDLQSLLDRLERAEREALKAEYWFRVAMRHSERAERAEAAIERVRAMVENHRSVERHNEMVALSDIADLIREPSSDDYLAALDTGKETG